MSIAEESFSNVLVGQAGVRLAPENLPVHVKDSRWHVALQVNMGTATAAALPPKEQGVVSHRQKLDLCGKSREGKVTDVLKREYSGGRETHLDCWFSLYFLVSLMIQLVS